MPITISSKIPKKGNVENILTVSKLTINAVEFVLRKVV